MLSDHFNGSPFVKVVPFDGATTAILVFSSANTKPGRFVMYRLLASAPVHMIFLNDRDNRYYQRGVPGLGDTVQEAAASLGAILEKFKVSRVAACGTSMGAHAAILYASLLGADRSLAFGPEIRTGLPESRSLLFMPCGLEVTYPDLRPVMSAARSRHTLVSGELDAVDVFAARDLIGMENAETILIRDCGHPPTPWLQGKLDLRTAILRYAESGEVTGFNRFQGTLVGRPDIMDLFHEAYVAVHQRANERSTLLARLRDEASGYALTHYTIGVNAIYEYRYADALRHHSDALRLVPGFICARQGAGRCHLMLGNYDAAVTDLEEVVREQPNNGAALRMLGRAEEKRGRFIEAERRLRAAFAYAPRNKEIKQSLTRFLREDIARRKEELRALETGLTEGGTHLAAPSRS